jgi:hypothetical protein
MDAEAVEADEATMDFVGVLLAPGWEGVVWKYLRRRRGFGLAENRIYKELLNPRDATSVMQPP